MTDPAEVFRAATQAVVAGDLDKALKYLDEDLTMDWSRSRGPLQGTYEGKSGARRYWEDMLDAWKPIAWELEVVGRPALDTVVLESKPYAQGQGSGIELQGRGGLIVRARDGKLVALTLFQSPEEALEWAGESSEP
jgi:ketosteroid isomerase-like protein